MTRDGDTNFLLGAVDPAGMVTYLSIPIRAPKGSVPTPRPASLNLELETFVCTLRDAEVLVLVAIPNTHVINRHDVF
jgi:hypothetical protein